MASSAVGQSADDIVSKFRCENGLCPYCGTAIYQVNRTTNTFSPLTLEGVVLNGRCLYCYPSDKASEGPPNVDPTAAAAAAVLNEPLEEESQSIGSFSVGDTVPESVRSQQNTSRMVTPSTRPDQTVHVSRAQASASGDVTDDSSVIEDKRKRAPKRNSGAPHPASKESRDRAKLPQRQKSTEKVKKRPGVAQKRKPENSTKKAKKDKESLTGIPASIIDIFGSTFKGYVRKGSKAKGEGRFDHVHEDDYDDLNGKTTTYDGEVAKGKMEGEGKLMHARGSVYEGCFKNGGAHGRGTCTWSTGWKYTGEWVDDERCGKGKSEQINEEDGEVYDGEWKADKRHGKGKLDFAGGGYVEGDFRNDKVHGKAKYVFADGSVYEGSFENDLRSGEGKMNYTETGEKYTGHWRHNQRNGKGRSFYQDGSIFQGDLKDDVPYNGVTLAPDGSEKKYKKGKLQKL